jgi:hypothetical protein
MNCFQDAKFCGFERPPVTYLFLNFPHQGHISFLSSLSAQFRKCIACQRGKLLAGKTLRNNSVQNNNDSHSMWRIQVCNFLIQNFVMTFQHQTQTCCMHCVRPSSYSDAAKHLLLMAILEIMLYIHSTPYTIPPWVFTLVSLYENFPSRLPNILKKHLHYTKFQLLTHIQVEWKEYIFCEAHYIKIFPINVYLLPIDDIRTALNVTCH